MKISLVVPCYLRGRVGNYMLNRLIESAHQQIRDLYQIIIVDDASPYLPEIYFEDVDYIRLSENFGPATARNHGIKRALENDNSYILFTDHDCILSRNWSLEMIDFLLENSLEAAGGITRAYGTKTIDLFHNFNGTLNGRLILPERKYLLYATTCNFAISRKLAEEFRFDETYMKAAGEDIDYCIRISKRYPIGLCRRALIWHDFGYMNFFTGISKMTGMFKKYKAGNRLLYRIHPDFFQNSWLRSEPIRERNFESSKWP